MNSHDTRKKFLEFFKKNGHAIVPSSPVIPHEDPTLLFTNAGMNQFKDVFLGTSKRDYTKAASAQKCVRAGGKHNDLENVGHTSRHLTFFEMLGNFSFGDYFKKEAISFAWQLSTEVFNFDPKFLYATVLHDDTESFELWKSYLPDNKIVKMGEADNFWAMGETGPSGPCSELYYDRGHSFGPARNPSEDPYGERFIEFWNLVFMEFNRKGPSSLEKLPRLSVDTGAGLERVIALQMGVHSLFETDILRELIAQVEHVFHVTYDPLDATRAPAFRVIADHLRTLAFAIADGAQPSNTDRGYVLRKILRRAVRYGRMLGREEPFLAHILPRLTATMGTHYPELKASEAMIAESVTGEEESFLRTLRRGGQLLSTVIEHAKGSGKISGEDAFKLKDTYGLPLDEITLLAKDSSLTVDLDAFRKLEAEAKERSRSARKESGSSLPTTLFEKIPPALFTGYKETKAPATIVALLKGERFVEKLEAGEEGSLLLDKTPFYAEKGGQVGDTGTIESPHSLFKVEDTQTPFPGVILHSGTVAQGSVSVGQTVTASVNAARRQKIANNHTATHLLHLALQHILGPHIKQAGSVVEESRLRFDFNHPKALTQEEIHAIEREVNACIRANTPVQTYEMGLEEASQKKEIKQFFGEKYGSRVRVVETGESKELCGGTHTSATGTIGFFKLSKESSISAGVRRIEAVTGEEAEHELREHSLLLQEVSALLKVQPAQFKDKVQSLLEENKALQGEKEELKKEGLRAHVEKLHTQIQASPFPFLIAEINIDPKELRTLCDLIRESSLALFLLTPTGAIATKVTPDLVKKGVAAGSWLKHAFSPHGKGGGGADFAQGKVSPEHVALTLKNARDWINNVSFHS